MKRPFRNNLGLTLLEVLIAMALAVTVMGGVVSVLVVSKNNFITERELAMLQENARFAINVLSDELRMAGYTGCDSRTLNVANSVNGSAGSWYLNGTGLEGFEHFSTEAGRSTFPAEFRADVRINTDAVVVRRGESMGLSLDGSHNPNSARLPLNKAHSIKPGAILVLSDPDCQQVGIFQVSGPTNNNNNAELIVHNTGSMNPGNCTKDLGGNFDCNSVGNSTATPYGNGSSLMRLRSDAYYIGTSAIGNDIPALFRESLVLNEATETVGTSAQELVQGVENMQLLYGLDNSGNDGIADIYLPANDAAMDWRNVVSVRIFLRMRSIYPVYNNSEPYSEFQDIDDTDGSDRFMRQLVTTTIQIRNG